MFILLQLSQFTPFSLLHLDQPWLPQSNPTLCPCPCVIHTCSLTSPFPFFPPLTPSPLPSGHCQSLPCFHVCGSILFISLFCSLKSSYIKGNPSALLVGMQTATATVENKWNFLKKLKMELPFDRAIPLLGLYPKNPKSPIQKNLCTQSS